MGKPSSSCFKIIGCGGGDAIDDDDDLGPEEVISFSVFVSFGPFGFPIRFNWLLFELALEGPLWIFVESS